MAPARRRRWRNVSGTGDYIARVQQGRSAVAEETPRDDRTRCEDALFMGLRLTEGVDLQRMHARYGVDVWDAVRGAPGPLRARRAPGARARATDPLDPPGHAGG